MIRNTLARYETTATSDEDIDVAFWVIGESYNTQRMLIKNIYPSDTSFDYTFTVSNFEVNENDNSIKKRAETDLEYELSLTTTTNLPLEYAIQKNGASCSTNETLITDSDGTYYKNMKLAKVRLNQDADRTDTYVLKVTFPKSNYKNLDYADLLEYIKIDMNAKQIIE